MALVSEILKQNSFPATSLFFFIQIITTYRELFRSYLAAVKSGIKVLSFDLEMAGTNGHNQDQVSLPASLSWATVISVVQS